ncbi:MAG: DoxX family protein [Halioglobus sp.]|nr:DoxX family protein [Halioglobus sp.]
MRAMVSLPHCQRWLVYFAKTMAPLYFVDIKITQWENIMKFLNDYSDVSYVAFRIVAGFLFLCHGTQKMLSYPVEFAYPLNAMSTSAGIIEIVAGALIILGFYSRIAAFIASGTMAVAYWMVHGLNHPFPIANGGELSALYCFCFLYIATKGPGKFSLNEK